jgi:hypothetical protein
MSWPRSCSAVVPGSGMQTSRSVSRALEDSWRMSLSGRPACRWRAGCLCAQSRVVARLARLAAVSSGLATGRPVLDRDGATPAGVRADLPIAQSQGHLAYRFAYSRERDVLSNLQAKKLRPGPIGIGEARAKSHHGRKVAARLFRGGRPARSTSCGRFGRDVMNRWPGCCVSVVRELRSASRSAAPRPRTRVTCDWR